MVKLIYFKQISLITTENEHTMKQTVLEKKKHVCMLNKDGWFPEEDSYHNIVFQI